MFEKINEDLKEALKSGDKFKLSVLRMMKSALQLEAINKKGELADEDVIAVLKKQVKQRNDSVKEYESLNKMEVVNDLKKEIEIISSYLPEEASEEQINKVIDDAFVEINPTSMKEMGLIMKYVSEHLKNVDNGKVSMIVKERLSK
jgi:uncharacterized protein YqeY